MASETTTIIHLDFNHFLPKLLAFARRLLSSLLIILSIIYLSFFGLEMARGTSFDAALQYGLSATVGYLGQLVRGDLGESTSVRGGPLAVPVAEVLPSMLINSLGLLAVALVLATVIGIFFGLLSVRRRRTSIAMLPLTLSLIGVSMPSFFIALLLQLGIIAAVRNWGVKPLPVAGFGWDTRLVLPALVLSARPIAQISRVISVALLDVLDQDFVRTATAKGLHRRVIRWRHVYPLIAIPVLTTLASSLRFMLSGLPVVELFFAWPGVGFNLLRSIARRDDALTVALVGSMGILFIGVNWLVDASFSRLDPRLSEETRQVLRQKRSFWQDLRDTLADAYFMLTHNRLVTWVRKRLISDTVVSEEVDDDQHSEFYREIARERVQHGSVQDVGEDERRKERLRAWRRATLMNPPLILGSMILLLLLIAVIFGSDMTPHNPYQQKLLAIVDGHFTSAPFEPSEEYPWGSDVLGRDVMSLVLAGAGRTLSLGLMIVLARMVVGFLLGAVAGWRAGGLADRAIVGLSEIIAAFPSLLLAMLLILALGIREGISVFVIALCFVGWGEVMHFVRNQVQAIRPQTYIESAVAIGLRSPKIIQSHVFPNLVSPLIALAALEMGAALMLLAELGFVGIFIGGGAVAQLASDKPWVFLYSDVPEWAAMLSNMRLWARSYPWTAIYPALAFFIAILGFNFFGEGLRLLIERVGVGFTKLLNRYTVAACLLAALAIFWVQSNVGPWRFNQQDAAKFNADRAMNDIAVLANEALEGRLLDSPGVNMAAGYVASHFEAMDMNPGGEAGTYYSTRRRDYAVHKEMPRLALSEDGEAWHDLEYQGDFNVYPSLHFMSGGDREGEIVFVGGGALNGSRNQWGGIEYKVLEKADLNDVFLLMAEDSYNELAYRRTDIRSIAGVGILVVVDNDDALNRYHVPSAHFQAVRNPEEAPISKKPILYISRAIAERLVAHAGYDLDKLVKRSRALGEKELLIVPTGMWARGGVVTEPHEKVDVTDVIATFIGKNASLNEQLVLVMAPYDGLGVGPDGTLYSGANDSASAVGVMLETIRSWAETDYQPDRSFMFVAYVRGGHPYGKHPADPLDPMELVEARYAHMGAFELEAIVHLGPVGGGSGNELLISAGGYQKVGDLFARSARSMGVKTRKSDEDFDVDALFASETSSGGARAIIDTPGNVPLISVRWEGAEEIAGRASDTLENIDPEVMQAAGEAISNALMTLGREMNY